MNDDIAQSLLSKEGSTLLAEAATLQEARTETLAALTRLRKKAPADLSAAAWEMANLRQRAQVKFGPASFSMFFTRESLEQASSRRASLYHAACFRQSQATHVTDLCGGIGGDALAFAHAGLTVTLFEQDSVRARFARANADVCGFGDRIMVRQEDVTTAELPPGAAWFDPARRVDSKRVAHPDDYHPPISFIRQLVLPSHSLIGIKIAPSIEHGLAEEYEAALEFISDEGECKEALLWIGGSIQNPVGVRATLLTDSEVHTFFDSPQATASPDNGQGQYLYEPDPAVIRAHLVGALAETLDARLVDTQIAYLLADRFLPTPWAQAYPIWERFPYSRRRLQETLTRHQIGQVVIKKRGFPLEPDAVRKQLKLSGTKTGTVILTRQGDTHLAFLCGSALL